MSMSATAAQARALGAVTAIAALGSGTLALLFEPRWPDPVSVQLADIGTLALGVAMLALVGLHRVTRAGRGGLVTAVYVAAFASALGVIVAMSAHLASGRVDEYTFVDIATIASVASIAALAALTWRSRRWALAPRVAMLLVQLAIAVAIPIALLTAINVGRGVATTAMALGYALVGILALVRPSLYMQERPVERDEVATTIDLPSLDTARG